MREALDDMDECDGVDDVIRQASSLYFSDDYKEVKHCHICIPVFKSIFKYYFKSH